jgi:5'-nucleotidase
MNRIASRLGAALTTAALFISAPSIGWALDIALTNDDGWDAIGIQAVKRALVRAGHTVTLAGPLNQQSGSSAAINETDLLLIRKERGLEYEGALEYSVALAPDGTENAEPTESAEPATSALVAIDIARERSKGRLPDLLVSGTNDGANLGSITQPSSTVGAAIVAMGSSFNGSVPAIAISTDPICIEVTEADTEDCSSRNEDHFARVADFLVGLIDYLQTKPGILRREVGLLPPGIGLNINYPPVEVPNGLVVARQGRTAPIDGLSVTYTIGCFTSCLGLEEGDEQIGGIKSITPDSTPELRNADTEAYAQGYIAIVPIVADFTIDGYKRYESVFRTLKY